MKNIYSLLNDSITIDESRMRYFTIFLYDLIITVEFG